MVGLESSERPEAPDGTAYAVWFPLRGGATERDGFTAYVGAVPIDAAIPEGLKILAKSENPDDYDVERAEVRVWGAPPASSEPPGRLRG